MPAAAMPTPSRAYLEHPVPQRRRRPRPAGAGARAEEPHVAVWREYAERARDGGRPRRRWPGVVRSSASRSGRHLAGRRLRRRDPARPLRRRRRVQPRRAARAARIADADVQRRRRRPLPLLIAGTRADFESLVRAFTERNEPRDVPASMGACFVKGLNNWDRVARYRRAWEAGTAPPATRTPGARSWAASRRRRRATRIASSS